MDKSNRSEAQIETLDGTKTYDASLDRRNGSATVRLDGERYSLGICTDYEEWFGGDVKYATYQTGPYTVTVKTDHRKQNGTQHRITVER